MMHIKQTRFYKIDPLKPFLRSLAIVLMLFTLTSMCYSQTYFTDQELQLLAKHNTERIYLKDLTQLQQAEIDTLYHKVDLMQQQTDLCQENVQTLNAIIDKLNTVDEKRKEQNAILVTQNQEQSKTIDKQARKIKRWRIATPILTSAAFIGALFINK
jgi:hypothetical protein